MRARKCAEVSRRARRISRDVFRRPFGTLRVCRSRRMRRDPFSSFPYASGRGGWLPRGLARGDGVGHAPLLERVRPVRSLLLGVLSARREGCAGGAGQWLDRGTPGKWPACRKKRRKRPGGDAPGAAEAAFGSARGEKGHAGDVRQTGRKWSASSRAACLSREGECENARDDSPPNAPNDIFFRENRRRARRSRFFSNAPTLPRAWRQAWRQAWRPPPLPRTASPRTATSRSTWTG